MKQRTFFAFGLLIILKFSLCYIETPKVFRNPETVRMIFEKMADKPLDELFEIYHFLYQKTYELDSEEGIERFQIWKENVKNINEENTKEHSYKLGLGPYTDLKTDEFTEKYMDKFENYKEQKERIIQEINSVENRKLIANSSIENDKDSESRGIGEYKPIDYESLFINPINQGKCGSSWAFSASTSIEGLYNKRNNDLNKTNVWFSPQQLVDCDHLNIGCNGGNVKDAFTYIKEKGLFDGLAYPYTSIKGSCKYNDLLNTNNQRVFIDGYEFCSNDSSRPCSLDTFLKLLSKGPISVHINSSNRKWIDYNSGVVTLNDEDCSTEAIQSVVAIGWGVDLQSGKTFIRLRNSAGIEWGENGYIRVEYIPNSKLHTCHILSLAIQPILK